MKGAYVVSADPAFWSSTTRLLSDRGAVVADGTIQLRDTGGRLFTMFQATEQIAEALAEPLETGPGLDQLPDLANVQVYAVECRSEHTFADVMQLVGQASPGTWVIDGDGVIWDSTMVDPATLRL